MVRFINENRTSKACIYGFWETKSSGSPGVFVGRKNSSKSEFFAMQPTLSRTHSSYFEHG